MWEDELMLLFGLLNFKCLKFFYGVVIMFVWLSIFFFKKSLYVKWKFMFIINFFLVVDLIKVFKIGDL